MNQRVRFIGEYLKGYFPFSELSFQFSIGRKTGYKWVQRYEACGVKGLIESAAVVPSIWPLDLVNILLVAERQKRLSESDSIRFLTVLSQLPIVVEYERPEMIGIEVSYCNKFRNVF